AMLLAMVVIGGAGSVPGAIVGAVVIAAYDQLLIPQLGVWLDRLRQASGGGLAAFDIRSLNSFYFGLALYLTILIRARPRGAAAPTVIQRLGNRMSSYLAALLARAQLVRSAEVPREE